MPKVTYITPSGETVVVPDAQDNLMEAAVEAGVEGIQGDCGGVGSCATCHVRIDPAWIDVVGRATDVEEEALEFEDSFGPDSRLGCQVELTDAHEGLVVHVVGP